MGNSKFVNSFNKLPKRKAIINSSLQGKTVMEEQYGFTITNTPVRVMQVGNVTSYTFHIERDSIDNTFFENLVVQNDSIGNTTANIIKYTPFTPMTSFTEHNSYSFEGDTEVTSIIYDDNQISENGKMVTDCRNLYGFRCTGSYSTANGSSCNAPSHIPTGLCTYYTEECIKYIFVTQSCTSYDDGMGDTTGGFNPGGGSSYGTGGGGTVPIFSDPVCGSNCIEPYEDSPCVRLNKLLNPTKCNIGPKLDILGDMLLNPANNGVENGFSFQMNSNGTYSNPEIPNQGEGSIKIPTGSNIYGAAHTHTDKLTDMFSWNDVYTLINLYRDASDELRNDIVFILVTASGKTYSIKIDNIRTLKNFMDGQFRLLKDKFPNKSTRDLLKMINEKSTFKGNQDDLERAFLNYYKDAGISLYETQYDNNSNPPGFNNWKKISLPANPSNPIDKTSCEQ